MPVPPAFSPQKALLVETTQAKLTMEDLRQGLRDARQTDLNAENIFREFKCVS